jgi:hypothetical protein
VKTSLARLVVGPVCILLPSETVKYWLPGAGEIDEVDDDLNTVILGIPRSQ